MRGRRSYFALACVGGFAIAGLGACGGERQDANEPDRSYEVEVVDASFPAKQRVGAQSILKITVKNGDEDAVPNITATVDGFYTRLDDRDLRDPNRPVFVVNSVRRQIGGYPDVKLDAPDGGPTSLVNTWTLGEMKPGTEKTFRWRVTAVRPGPFEVSYRISAGTEGKALAVDVSGEQPRGSFSGSISEDAPESRIAADGQTVIKN